MDRSDDRPAIISDLVTVKGTVTPLSLIADGTLQWPEGGQRSLTVEKEVLGFSADGPNIKLRTIVETGDGCSCTGGSRATLVRNDVIFRPSSEESHRLWCQKLREFIDSLETKHQLHANEVVGSLDVSKYDGIVCVSGDGILVEVVNGLLEREDWDTAIKMPLGVVPAGTGNGMAKSLLDSVGDPCAVANAVLAIIRGHKRSVDVATITQGETRFFSILMLAWGNYFHHILDFVNEADVQKHQGLVADIDIESEKFRWMGSARIDFYALLRIFHLRHYTGCVYFVPAPGFEADGEPTRYPGNSTSKGSNSDPVDVEPVELKRQSYQGPETNLENQSWRVVNGPFISVWLHNVPWGAENTMAAPDAKFSDGYLDLIIVKNCPKLPLLSMMSELNNGGHVNSPYVMYLKVKAFILEPGPQLRDQEKEGIIDADGEVLARGKGSFQCEQKALMAYDKLQITVDQGLATLFSPVELEGFR